MEDFIDTSLSSSTSKERLQIFLNYAVLTQLFYNFTTRGYLQHSEAQYLGKHTVHCHIYVVPDSLSLLHAIIYSYRESFEIETGDLPSIAVKASKI